MNDTNDFPFDEQDSSNQRLVRDLEHRYATGLEDAQHLAHVRERLFSNSEENQTYEYAHMRANGRLEPYAKEKREGAYIQTIRRGIWSSRMNQVAAVLLTALLVGALVLVFRHIPHPTTVGMTGSTFLAVRSLQMNDASTGWLLTEQTVFRTSDGGVHWKNVTPVGLQLSVKSVAVFSSAMRAWIAVPQENAATTHIWRTTDGGTTWLSTALPVPFPRAITFVDAQHGWLLASQSDQSQDASAETIEVYRTEDSGKTWVQLQTASALAASTDAPPPGHLPFGGQKSGIHFLNASTGWVTGTVIVDGLSWLYRTHDAGATWQQQLLPLPAGEPSAQLVLSYPLFFTARDGLLPVTFLGHGLCIYVTHDAGTTWQPTRLASFTPTTVTFADMHYGWMTDGSTLLVTTDGGQQWRKQSTNSSFQHITILAFTSSTSGWAVSTQAGNASAILKTNDGGHTWTFLGKPGS